MSHKPRTALRFTVYGLSVALHVALAAGAVFAPKMKKSQIVAISLSEGHKAPPKKDPPPPPPPTPPPPPPPLLKAKAAPVPVAMADSNPAQPTSNEPTPPSNGSSDGFADLGLMMGNGSGGGLSVPASQRRVAEAPRQEEVHKVRAFAPTHDACDQPPTKAKLHGALIKPTYTDAARTAQIEGVVRIELTVDEQGGVIDVKVLRGLGYGLDESAVAAAKKLAFEPGTRCNKAAVTKLTVGMRFTLQQ